MQKQIPSIVASTPWLAFQRELIILWSLFLKNYFFGCILAPFWMGNEPRCIILDPPNQPVGTPWRSMDSRCTVFSFWETHVGMQQITKKWDRQIQSKGSDVNLSHFSALHLTPKGILNVHLNLHPIWQMLPRLADKQAFNIILLSSLLRSQQIITVVSEPSQYMFIGWAGCGWDGQVLYIYALHSSNPTSLTQITIMSMFITVPWPCT